MFPVQLWTLYNFSARSIHAAFFPCSLGVRCAHVFWVARQIFEFPFPRRAQLQQPLGNPMFPVKL